MKIFKMLLAQKMEAEKGRLSLYQNTHQNLSFRAELIDLLIAQYRLEQECDAKLRYLAALHENPNSAVMADQIKIDSRWIEKSYKSIEKFQSKSIEIFNKKINKIVTKPEGEVLLKKAKKEFQKWIEEFNIVESEKEFKDVSSKAIDLEHFIHKPEFNLN